MLKPIAGAALLTLAGFGAFAQQEAAKAPEFEVASVKPSAPMNTTAMAGGGGSIRISMGCGQPDPGRFTCNNMPLRAMITLAYDVKSYQVTGPGWIDSERFDIVAKLPAGATKEQVHPMLQKLLTDRFQMTFHRENKELPVYALVVGKNGHKLKESKDDGKELDLDAAPPPPPPPGSGGGGQMGTMIMRSSSSGGAGTGGSMRMNMRNGLNELTARKSTVADLARMLSNQVDRPVLDESGIPGTFDFTLDFASDETMRGNRPGAIVIGTPAPSALSAAPGAPGADAREPASAPSIFSAVQNQLGLKLEPKKSPVEMIVVDKAEKTPLEN